MRAEAQSAEGKADYLLDVLETMDPLLHRYGPVVLREQVWRWLEMAPRNRTELEARDERNSGLRPI
jgi:hypothetical protein